MQASLEAQLASALDARTRPLRLFFRDDDADEDLPALRALLDLFEAHETPLSLAVIPGGLTAACAERLRARGEAVEITQHGWRHRNHEREGRKCEFGPSRAEAEQRADLLAGRARLDEAFGVTWTRVFVPPWNRCTEATARLLAEMEFEGLSRIAGSPPLATAGLREIPVTLDLFTWRDGARLRGAEDIARELAAQLAANDCIGVMLHHKVMDDEARALVAAMLRAMRRAPIVECHTFRSLLALPE